MLEHVQGQGILMNGDMDIIIKILLVNRDEIPMIFLLQVVWDIMLYILGPSHVQKFEIVHGL